MILQIALITLTIVLIINAIYLFVFSVAGTLKKQNNLNNDTNTGNNKKFLVLLPGYKEDSVIINSVISVIGQNYASNQFKCVVIADDFQSSTIEKLKELGSEVFVLPNDAKRNKAKAIQQFLASSNENFDACVLLDADNCVESDMLFKANNYLNNGVRILQAKRVAKNQNNSMSRLDALSELINNHIFRKGQRALGLSSSLIGSGMIIEMGLFRKVMENMNVFSGFDKEMELRILKAKLTIEYTEDILIFDEKVSQQNVYVNQRKRWIYAQLFFLKKNFLNSIKELAVNHNVDYFNKVVQFALLPRVICLGMSLILIPISLFAGKTLLIVSITSFLLIFVALILPVKDELKMKELVQLSIKIPAAFLGMIKAILTSQQAAKKFIHTPHNNQH